MPYLGSTLFFVTLVVALFIALNGYFLMVRALLPRFVERTAARWRKRPVLTPLLGGVVGSLAALVAILFLAAGPGLAKLIGTVLAVFVLAVALAGTTGLASVIGDGLASPADEGRMWFRCFKGGVVLELSFLLPFFGWFFVLPVALFGGFGATIMAVISALLEGTRAAGQHAQSA